MVTDEALPHNSSGEHQSACNNVCLTPDVPLLAAENLSKSYDHTRVLDDVSFTVSSGEIVVFLGPNGAGKTTTIEICEGLITPDTGSVQVLGNRVGSREWENVRGNIGVMMQSGGFYNAASADAILSLVASYYSTPHDTTWLLELLDLWKVRKTPYRHLSGGQKQRLSFACAIVGRPQLLFLDEPSAGLDIHGRMLMSTMIMHLKHDGVGIVLTTHNMEEIEHLADKIIILSHGKVMAQGALSELLHTANHDMLYFSAEKELDIPDLMHFFTSEYSHQLSADNKHILVGSITPRTIHTLTQYGVDHDIVFSDIHIGKNNITELLLNLT